VPVALLFREVKNRSVGNCSKYFISQEFHSFKYYNYYI